MVMPGQASCASPIRGQRPATRAVIARARTQGQWPRPHDAAPAGSAVRWGMDDRARSPSPTRQFAVLSLLTIGGSTLVVGLALAHFVEQAILEREWTSTAAFVRAAAHDHLRSQDFSSERRAPPPDSQD